MSLKRELGTKNRRFHDKMPNSIQGHHLPIEQDIFFYQYMRQI